MANSLLERMAHKRPVLASAAEGNRFLEDGVTGLLYSGEAEFKEKAERLILDDSLRKKLGEAGRRYLLENCSPEVEAVRYMELYATCLFTFFDLNQTIPLRHVVYMDTVSRSQGGITCLTV